MKTVKIIKSLWKLDSRTIIERFIWLSVIVMLLCHLASAFMR